MQKFYLTSLFILMLTACSQEAQPYEEENRTAPTSMEQGYIETH